MSLADIAYIQPRTILDIGANIGTWALEAHAVWPAADIKMIEGNTACIPYLRETGFPFHAVYLSEHGEDMELYRRKGGGTDTGNSFYRELTQFFDDPDIEVVATWTLDQAVFNFQDLGSEDVWQPDFIKLDTQGSELDIIRGGVDIVKAAQHVLLEVAIVPYNAGAPLEPEVLSVMDSLGFTKRKCIGNICHPLQREVIVQRDILFSK